MEADYTTTPGTLARRTHITLTAIFVISVILIELGTYVRSIHMALLFLTNLGFLYAVMAFMIALLLTGIEPDGGFHLTAWASRALVWLCVVTIGTLAMNALRLGLVMGGHGTAHPDSPFFANLTSLESITHQAIEGLVVFHLYHTEWFTLLLLLLFVIFMMLLCGAVILYYGKDMLKATGYYSMNNNPDDNPQIVPYSSVMESDPSTTLLMGGDEGHGNTNSRPVTHHTNSSVLGPVNQGWGSYPVQTRSPSSSNVSNSSSSRYGVQPQSSTQNAPSVRSKRH